MKIHIDTDLGGDPDDACALAMLLGWPAVEITGITTSLDRHGLRAAYVAHVLALAGQGHVPVAAGAGVSLTTLAPADPVIGDERHWPLDLVPVSSAPGDVLDMLAASIDAGAVIVSIGPYTNLALLDVMRPGLLGRATVVVMGGWVSEPAPGLPPWGPEMDFNVQFDTMAADVVFGAAGDLTLVTLSATLAATLRAAYLPRLRAAGPLGSLLADQSEAHGEEHGMTDLGRLHVALPDDLLNFHYDPVTCAVAAGWPGATIEEMRLSRVAEDGVSRFVPDASGRLVQVVTEVDGAAFSDLWLGAIEASHR